MGEIAIIFGVCLLSEGISALLPIPFPASVISIIVLLVLLLAGTVKDRHIRHVCGFFTGNMAFFFVPSCVGILEHVDALAACLVPFLLICIVTTPLVYVISAWTVQLTMKLRERGQSSHD